MTAINVKNPFFRNNPFYIPQRFFSQEKSINPYYQGERGNSDKSSLLNNPYQSNKIVQYKSYKEQSSIEQKLPLRKKNINLLQNPFYRKNLLCQSRIKEQIQCPRQTYNLADQHKRLFQSISPKKIETNNFLKIPSLTQICQDGCKQNIQKYLSSELKLKFKSQAQIQCSASAIYLTSKKELAKEQAPAFGFPSIERQQQKQLNRLPPSILNFRGKTYYLQNIMISF